VEPLPIVFPQQMRFTCRMCAGCCRAGWHITLSDGEAERFRHHDWATARPRTAGLELLEPVGEDRWNLGRVDGACVFLDEDNLCAIQKELGADSKPLMCRQFPYHLTATPDGIVASLDFACPTVVANDGAPLAEQESDIRAIATDLQTAAAGTDSPTQSARAEKQPQIRAGVPLAWADYLVLERILIEVLEDLGRPLTERLLICDQLVQEADKRSAPGAMQPWLDGVRSADWGTLVTSSPRRASPMRQRALISWPVAIMEYAWAKQRKRPVSANSRVSMALAIVPGQKELFLHSADASLNLLRMRNTRFAQDDVRLTETLTRYLSAFVARKGLIKSTTVRDGYRYFVLYVGTIRWYAVARAVMAGREAVEEGDVRWAIQLVERTLSHINDLRSPQVMRFLNLAFDHIAPASVLIVSTHPT